MNFVPAQLRTVNIKTQLCLHFLANKLNSFNLGAFGTALLDGDLEIFGEALLAPTGRDGPLLRKALANLEVKLAEES